jgi:hypothetical protein
MKEFHHSMASNTVEIVKELKALPEVLREAMPSSSSGIARTDIMGMESRLTAAMTAMESRIASRSEVADGQNETMNLIASQHPTNHLFSYNGGFHYVPENFNFPSGTANSMWLIWHFGIKAHNIGPLKMLQGRYRCDVPSQNRILVDKAALVMGTIRRIAIKIGVLSEADEITAANQEVVWNRSYKEYISILYGDSRANKESFRYDDLYYTTLYNVHTKKVEGGCRFEVKFEAKYPSNPHT